MAKKIQWEFFDISEASMQTIESEKGPILIEQHSIHDDLLHFIGNCNFPITKSIVNKLDNIDGIEILYVLSKHRFMIAVGKLYNITDIKYMIDVEVCQKNNNEIELDKLDNARVKLEIDNLEVSLKKDYKYWAIYVYPNGQIDYCASNELNEDFLNKYECFNEYHKYSKGVLIHGEEKYQD